MNIGLSNLFSAALLGFALSAAGGDMKDCPMMGSTGDAPSHGHSKDVQTRGDKGMGFSHEKTTHHFILTAEGGSIEVTANDLSDAESRDQIRMHLAHIAKAFAAGDFAIPMFVHDATPPGVSTMKRRRDAIAYKYEDFDRGGRVRLSTENPDARDAIHDFLRFQITEHETGDPLRPAGAD